MVDSNYATNLDDRRSVSGCLNTIGGMLKNWSSKTQPVVTLSSTEAEYISLEYCSQETLFQNYLLSELNVYIKPGYIFEDNTGEIFLVTNRQVGKCTKHIDVKNHFVHEASERVELMVEHVEGEKNSSDIMTKNVSEMVFNIHSPNILNVLLMLSRENVKSGG